MAIARCTTCLRDGHWAHGFTLIELMSTTAIIVILALLAFPAYGVIRARAANAKCQSNLRQLGLAVLSYVSDNEGWYPISGSVWAAPPGTSWDVKLLPYLQGGSGDRPLDVLHCPSDSRPLVVSESAKLYARSYSMNGIRQGFLLGDGLVDGVSARKSAQLNHPNKTILIMENFSNSSGTQITNYQYSYNWSYVAGWLGGDSQAPKLRNGKFYHGQTMNFCFADGHVEAFPPASANTPNDLWTAVD